jgi:hypothetical protein
MVNPLEFRFEIKAYSPNTMPMARLARYLQNLANVLGEPQSVHLVRLEAGSTIPVLAVDWESVPKVQKRAVDVRNNEGPKEARAAKLTIERDLAEDNAEYGDLLDPQGARILHFSGVSRVGEPEYGPFSQPGTLDGIPIVIGGEHDPVPVHLQDRDRIHNCLATRDVAKAIGLHLFTTPIRAVGVGRWFRASDGAWEIRHFLIQDFTPLKHESLGAGIARLQSIEAEWKRLDDPLGGLIALRDSEA